MPGYLDEIWNDSLRVDDFLAFFESLMMQENVFYDGASQQYLKDFNLLREENPKADLKTGLFY